MEVVLKKLPLSNFDTFYMACWMIWSCLNKLVFDNKLPSHKDLWRRANLYRMEFLEVHQKNGQMVNSSAAKWNPPQPDSIYNLNLAMSQKIQWVLVPLYETTEVKCLLHHVFVWRRL